VLETYLAAAVLGAASVAVGAAIAKLSGADPWSGWAPAVGLATLIVAATLGVKLPGDGTAGAGVIAVLAVAAAVFVARDLRPPRPEIVLAAAGVLLLFSLPFIATGRVDLPGVGINNDTALHLSWAESLRTGSTTLPLPLPTNGYPLGDHALVAALADALGTDVTRGFTALLLAVPLLTMLAALPALERLSRTLEKSILEAAGYDVAVAVDGEDGWRQLQERGADLLISDVEMPRMDGFTLAETVRTSGRFADLPIVLFTSRGSEHDKARGIAVGANAYIVKGGFDQKDLLETVAQLL